MNYAGLFSKKTVFVRPFLPTGEQVFEDLSNTTDDDIAFKILTKEDDQISDDISEGNEISINNINTYHRLRSYLKTREQLKNLSRLLSESEHSLTEDKSEMNNLAKNLRQQAQEALST